MGPHPAGCNSYSQASASVLAAPGSESSLPPQASAYSRVMVNHPSYPVSCLPHASSATDNRCFSAFLNAPAPDATVTLIQPPEPVPCSSQQRPPSRTFPLFEIRRRCFFKYVLLKGQDVTGPDAFQERLRETILNRVTAYPDLPNYHAGLYNLLLWG